MSSFFSRVGGGGGGGGPPPPQRQNPPQQDNPYGRAPPSGYDEQQGYGRAPPEYHRAQQAGGGGEYQASHGLPGDPRMGRATSGGVGVGGRGGGPPRMSDRERKPVGSGAAGQMWSLMPAKSPTVQYTFANM